MGCLIGGKLQAAGYEVAYLARGAQCDALRSDGLTLETEGECWHAPVTAPRDLQEIGVADVVLLTTKSYQLPQAATMLAPLIHPHSVIIPLTNGIPWWYFFDHSENHNNRRLVSLDPDGVLERLVPLPQVIGGVNYLAGTLVAPGHVRYVNELKGRIALGERDGTLSARLAAVSDALDAAGFATRRSENIRQVIWHKLWGNSVFNPVSALTHATQDGIAKGVVLADGTQDIRMLVTLMEEVRTVAQALGITLDQAVESRIAAAAKMKGHRTSMEVDIRQGKPTEIEAILGVVREIADWYNVPTPRLDTLYGLLKMKEQAQAAAGILATSAQR